MIWLHHIGNWLFSAFGISGSGSHYGFWSGAGSDVGEVTLIGAVLMGVRHLNCHQHRCWRLGKHPFHHYRLCSKHHPGVPERVTAGHLADLAQTEMNRSEPKPRRAPAAKKA